ncbi:MAG: hypothetical protein AAFQ65_06135 [Myxococcota bacterium]
MIRRYMFATLCFGLIPTTAHAAGTTGSYTIESVQVRDNRIWINLASDLNSNETSRGDRSKVEISNANPNKDAFVKVALSAVLAGKQVRFTTTDTCSNVNVDLVSAIIFPG